MPNLEVQTNVDPSLLTPDLAARAAQVVADALGKPKSFVCVSFKTAVMSWGGGTGPTAIAHLGSIGQIDRDKNKKTSKAISSFLIKELGLPEDQFYIVFHNLNKENVGWKGTTFDDIL